MVFNDTNSLDVTLGVGGGGGGGVGGDGKRTLLAVIASTVVRELSLFVCLFLLRGTAHCNTPEGVASISKHCSVTIIYHG